MTEHATAAQVVTLTLEEALARLTQLEEENRKLTSALRLCNLKLDCSRTIRDEQQELCWTLRNMISEMRQPFLDEIEALQALIRLAEGNVGDSQKENIDLLKQCDRLKRRRWKKSEPSFQQAKWWRIFFGRLRSVFR